MTVAEIEAIVGGYHGDPFRILGPHRIEKPRGTPSWEVRAFLPQAESAEVILEDKLLQKLEGGKTATFIIFQTPEEGIGIPVSLKGFSEGFDKLP